jgi:hypothetical protein
VLARDVQLARTSGQSAWSIWHIKHILAQFPYKLYEPQCSAFAKLRLPGYMLHTKTGRDRLTLSCQDF